jgi:hypothetical protein
MDLKAVIEVMKFVLPVIIISIILIFLIRLILSWVYLSFVNRDIWSIGIYRGTNPFKFTSLSGSQKNPVLSSSEVTDVPARFVADPFMVRQDNRYYMFFEVFNALSRQGDIGLALSDDGVKWQYQQIVLTESFHLSYPYVFKWKDSYYMIPESRCVSSVKLYKATEFPIKWTFLNDLILGDYADSSVMFKDNKWWLFALKGSDTLTLHYADTLTGPWTEHPASPVISGNINISRPAGRLIVLDDKVIRYSQDGEPSYGYQIRAFEIDLLTTTEYEEHEVANGPVLAARGSDWNADGMHNIDPHQISPGSWIACVDGKIIKREFNWKLGLKLLLGKFKVI